MNAYRVGRSVISLAVVFFAAWINVVLPEMAADKASREAKNEFFHDLQRQHQGFHGRGIALSDPEMQKIYEFDGMEARRSAAVAHFERIKYPMGVVYLIAFALGVCRIWAAGCMAALLILPMALTREYAVFIFQLGGILAGLAVYISLVDRRFLNKRDKERLG